MIRSTMAPTILVGFVLPVGALALATTLIVLLISGVRRTATRS
jgi:hypothetical protein